MRASQQTVRGEAQGVAPLASPRASPSHARGCPCAPVSLMSLASTLVLPCCVALAAATPFFHWSDVRPPAQKLQPTHPSLSLRSSADAVLVCIPSSLHQHVSCSGLRASVALSPGGCKCSSSLLRIASIHEEGV